MRARPLPCSADIDAIAVAPPNKAIAPQCLFCQRHHGAPSNHEYLDTGSARSRSGFVRLAVLVFHHPIPFIAFGNSHQRHHHPAVF